ncbi:MAG: hypothetical protein KME42_08575 [Tildeniella nuda ZEHNDER 1965/U140]|jgi:hypothetical protein|nr:hypothetical protein [Tildeniella nuda ZEHNDER 1965/U140]
MEQDVEELLRHNQDQQATADSFIANSGATKPTGAALALRELNWATDWEILVVPDSAATRHPL